GRWLVYLPDPDDHLYGGLDSGATAAWTVAPFGTVGPDGNRYAFAEQPKLIFTSIDGSKVYGDVADLSGLFDVTGYRAGVSGAFLGDGPGAYSGTPVLTSTGANAEADAGGGGFVDGA